MLLFERFLDVIRREQLKNSVLRRGEMNSPTSHTSIREDVETVTSRSGECVFETGKCFKKYQYLVYDSINFCI